MAFRTECKKGQDAVLHDSAPIELTRPCHDEETGVRNKLIIMHLILHSERSLWLSRELNI